MYHAGDSGDLRFCRAGQHGQRGHRRGGEHCAGRGFDLRLSSGGSGCGAGNRPLAGHVRQLCHPLALHGQERSAASPAEYPLQWETPMAVYSAGNIARADAADGESGGDQLQHLAASLWR